MDNMIFALGNNDTDKQFDKTKLKILNEYLKFRNKNLLEINHDISLMLKNILLTKFQYIEQRGKTIFIYIVCTMYVGSWISFEGIIEGICGILMRNFCTVIWYDMSAGHQIYHIIIPTINSWDSDDIILFSQRLKILQSCHFIH